MSIEAAAGALSGALKSVTDFIESVRKGPLLAVMLLLAGQNVYERLNSKAVATQLLNCQEARIKEKDLVAGVSHDLVESDTRVVHLQDSLMRMQAEQISNLRELLNKEKK